MNIGTLSVAIVADIQKFTSGLATARKSLGTFADSLASFQTVIGGVVGGAFASFITSTVDAGSAIADTAKKLGIGTEALQEFRFVADQLGGSAEGMERSLGFFNKTLGQALNGVSGATAAFASLGITLEEIKNQKFDETFLQAVEAIRKIPNEAQQAAAAMAVFGKQGQEMLVAIRAGAEEIENLRRKIRESGGIVSDQSIQNLESMGDTLGQIKTQLNAIKMEVVGTAAPAASTWLDYLLAQIRQAKNELIDFPKQILIDALGSYQAQKVGLLPTPKPPAAKPAVPNPYMQLQGARPSGKSGDFKAFGDFLMSHQKSQAELQAMGDVATFQFNMMTRRLFAQGFGGLGRFLGFTAMGAAKPTPAGIAPLGITPGFSMPIHGSAESYRQQAAIRRESESVALQKRQTKAEEKQVGLLEKIAAAIGPVKITNFAV